MKKHYNPKFIAFVKKFIRLQKLVLPAVFALVLVIGLIASSLFFLRPKVSATEKRELAKFPRFTFSSFFDGTFFAGIDTWFSDTFPGREGLIKANGSLKNLKGFGDEIYGLADNIPPEDMPAETSQTTTEKASDVSSTTKKTSESTSEKDADETAVSEKEQTEPTVANQAGMDTQALGNVLVIGGTGYGYSAFVSGIADRYAAMIDSVQNKLGSDYNVYSIIVPTSMDITMTDSVRKKINSADQSKTISYIFDELQSSAVGIDIFHTMRMHRDEYIYFRTDHHWTALGAYYAYCDIIKAVGKNPKPLTSYTEESYGEFLGSFYTSTQSAAMRKNADELIAYVPKYKTLMQFTTTDGNTYTWDLVNDTSSYPVSEKYSAFAAADNPFTDVENKSMEKGDSCLVIKESYGNALIPFLAGNYKHVYEIDYRYSSAGFVTKAKELGVKDIFFINNTSSVCTDGLVSMMEKCAF